MTRWIAFPALGVLALGLAVGCTRTYERGEALYRQGDLRGALDVWHALTLQGGDKEVQGRVQLVQGELERSFRLYEKRGRYYEDEKRPAEALLYYRLALKLDPAQAELMERVQRLVRELSASKQKERTELARALAEHELLAASAHAESLAKLDPFDPAVQLEVRDVRTAVAAELARHLAAGKNLYASGAREPAADEFLAALELDDDNEEALGYLSYLRDGEGPEPEGDEPSTSEASSSTAATLSRSAPGESLRRRRVSTPITQEDILAEGHFRSAAQAEKEGDLYWAIQQYEAALRVNSRHVAARKRLKDVRARLQPEVESLDDAGKRYFRDEDVQNALVMWRRVLLIDPTRERTIRNVEDAEKILSRLEEIQGVR